MLGGCHLSRLLQWLDWWPGNYGCDIFIFQSLVKQPSWDSSRCLWHSLSLTLVRIIREGAGTRIDADIALIYSVEAVLRRRCLGNLYDSIRTHWIITLYNANPIPL